jgi:hypoxanthine phosphoribosyltransferase
LVCADPAWHADGVAAQPAVPYAGDIKSVLLTEEQIRGRVTELGQAIGECYRQLIGGDVEDLLLVTVLKGAVMFVTALARAIPLPTQLEFMAVSSYGSATSSSGVVRILKDLDRDIQDRDVLIVEDIVDSGLTLSWLLRNLAARHPRSLRVCTLLRKPDAVRSDVDMDFVGCDLPYIGTLDPRVYEE